MELASRRIRVPDDRTVIRIYPVGDLHLGAEACDRHAAEYVVKRISQDQNAFWIGMGDYHDAIAPSDPRWNIRHIAWPKGKKPDVSDLAGEIVQDVDSFFAPIWSKCLGLLAGNHEAIFSRHYYSDLTKRLCSKHSVPYLGQTTLYRLLFEGPKWTVRYDVFAEHGSTGGTGTDGNAINDFIKRLSQFDAQIYLRGHVHKKGCHKRVELAWGAHKPRVVSRVLVLTGSYLRSLVPGETTYNEGRGYGPSELGGMVVLIRPKQGDIEAVDLNALALI